VAMHEQDIAETKERYRKRWIEYGNDPRTLGWNKDCQWVRFEAVFEGLRPDEFGSVLDVGCGFGDLLSYLRWRGWKGRYVGIDLVSELIQEACRLHSQDAASEFVCADVARVSPDQRCELAVAIGAFNHRVVQGNVDFIKETMEKMWTLSSRAIACDFLSTSSDPERRAPNLYYADPVQIFAMAAHYSRRVMLHHAYMPFEFQIKAWHDDQFTIAEPVFAPYVALTHKQSQLRLTMPLDRTDDTPS
jgi:SAM-dependent methyltransferase